MTGSRRLALIFAALLAVLAALSLASGPGGFGAPYRLNADTAAVHAAGAVWGLIAARMGSRASNVFLVALGLAFCTDAFMGFTRGVFYLSFDAMREQAQPMPRPDRLAAVAVHALLGAIALIAGLRYANADARRAGKDAPPT